MGNWKDKLSCFTPNYEEHDVGDETLHFYPVSVGLIFELRKIGKPLARSLAVIFDKNDKDQGTQDIIEKDEHGQDRRELIVMPMNPELAQARHQQKTDAIGGLVESLTAPENVAVIGRIIMDSLREVFPPGDKNNPPPEGFMQELPANAFGQMLVGVAKANKEVLGPLTERATEAVEGVVARIGKHPDNSEPQSEETEETSPTNG